MAPNQNPASLSCKGRRKRPPPLRTIVCLLSLMECESRSYHNSSALSKGERKRETDREREREKEKERERERERERETEREKCKQESNGLNGSETGSEKNFCHFSLQK